MRRTLRTLTLALAACTSTLSFAVDLSFWSWRVEDKDFYDAIAKEYKAISGDDVKFIAYKNTEADYALINHVPIFRAYEKGMGHTATYRTANGGAYSRVAVRWLDWQLKGDRDAASWFKGSDCRLCTNPMWVVRKKNID